jgi:iron(III) transport system substrate-binding protein
MSALSSRLKFCAASALLVLSTGVMSNARAQTVVPNALTDVQIYEQAKKESGALLITGMPYAVAKILAAEFEKKYPGVHLDVIYLVGLELYQRFSLETKNNQHLIDIMHINDFPSMKSLVEQGNIAAWKVPTAERFGKYRIGDSAYSLYFTDVVAMYNETRVTEDEAKLLERWDWATDPRFKARFGVAIQRCSTCYAPMQTFLDPENMKQGYGWPFLEKIADNKPGIYRNTDFMGDRVAAGEKDIAFTEAEGYAFGQRYRGAPVRWKIPSPAPSFPNAWIGVSKFAPHPYTARLYLNWITSEEGAHQLQDKYGARTILEGVPDTRAVTKEPWYTKKVIYQPIDFDRWASEQTAVMAKWEALLNARAR